MENEGYQLTEKGIQTARYIDYLMVNTELSDEEIAETFGMEVLDITILYTIAKATGAL